MKYIKDFENFERVTNPQIDATWDMNAPYSWDAVPARDKKDYKWHPNVDIKEIEIGADDPVLKFRDWCGNFWAKKEKRFKKQDKGQNE